MQLHAIKGGFMNFLKSALLTFFAVTSLGLLAQASNEASANPEFNSIAARFNAAQLDHPMTLTHGLFLRGICHYSERAGYESSLVMAVNQRQVALVKDVSEEINSFEPFLAAYPNKFTEIIREQLSGDLMVDYVFSNFAIREDSGAYVFLHWADRTAGSFACVIEKKQSN